MTTVPYRCGLYPQRHVLCPIVYRYPLDTARPLSLLRDEKGREGKWVSGVDHGTVGVGAYV